MRTYIKESLQCMGLEELRPGQKELIYSVMDEEDTLGIMPTSHGKSLVYIVPTLAKQWRALILSPLISLQTDQVSKLTARNRAAAAMNSSYTYHQNQDTLAAWQAGLLQFLFAAPERLDSVAFRNALNVVKPNLVVIDEVHCVSKWGTNFRPAYNRIAGVVKSLQPLTILGLTATLTPSDEKEVRDVLEIPDAKKFVYYARRSNLKFKTRPWSGITKYGKGIDGIVDALDNITGSAVIYSPTVVQLKVIYAHLRKYYESVVTYHGQMSMDARRKNQDAFMSGEADIIVATNAFGMGIDKKDIRGVIHAGTPASIEAYIQEAGRAGRDGLDAQCILLDCRDMYNKQMLLLSSSYPPRAEVARVAKFLVGATRGGKESLQVTIEELSNRLDMYAPALQSCMGILKTYGVIEREQGEYVHSLTIDTSCESDIQMHAEAERMQLVFDVLKENVDDEGRASFEPEDLKNQSNCVSVKQLNFFLYQLKMLGAVSEWNKASRARMTKVVNVDYASLVDWDKLEKDYNREVEGLHQMYEFVRIPDEQKHAAAEKYFREGKLPESDECEK